MKNKMLLWILPLFIIVAACSKDATPENAEKTTETQVQESDGYALNENALITFYELGSTTCIPCKQMKPVIESIAKKYGEQINVVFIDVNKERARAGEFGIRLIPTQIFHDSDGNEIHRHEGFYAESDIDDFLQNKGLKIIDKSGTD